jgi:hypothetical protein
VINAEYNVVVSRLDWRAEYGYPCFVENKQFGTLQHSYIVTSNGAYFFSPGLYDYWVSRDNVKGVLLTDKNGEASEHLQNVRLDGDFKFNVVAGPYSWFGHFDVPAEDVNLFAVAKLCYYIISPGQSWARSFGVWKYFAKTFRAHYNTGSILFYDQYCEKRNWGTNILLSMNRAPAAPVLRKLVITTFVGACIEGLLGNEKTACARVIHTFIIIKQCRIINNGNPIVEGWYIGFQILIQNEWGIFLLSHLKSLIFSITHKPE